MSILLLLVLGIIAFFLINYLGGRHIQQSYQNDLFDDEFGKSTVFNIAFRIIAPRRCPHPLWCPLLFCWPPFPILVSFDLWRNLLDPSHFGMGVKAPNRSL